MSIKLVSTLHEAAMRGEELNRMCRLIAVVESNCVRRTLIKCASSFLILNAKSTRYSALVHNGSLYNRHCYRRSLGSTCEREFAKRELFRNISKYSSIILLDTNVLFLTNSRMSLASS